MAPGWLGLHVQLEDLADQLQAPEPVDYDPDLGRDAGPDDHARAAIYSCLHTWYAGRGTRDARALAHRGATAALLRRDGLTLDEIARRLGVGKRSVERDLELYASLRGAGPLQRIRGPVAG